MSVRALVSGSMPPRVRMLLALSGLMVLAALVLPIWEIYLWSQQYPEGLRMTIHARTLTGNLQSINILNHYIGMKPLSVSSFSEFVWMTPTLLVLGGWLLLLAALGRSVGMLLGWFALWGFDLFMLADLYRWMYDWGHDLDPRAPMTIQPFIPPVLGFKHVANFDIYSFPSWGGALIVLASLMGLYGLWYAYRSAP